MREQNYIFLDCYYFTKLFKFTAKQYYILLFTLKIFK